MAVYHWRSLSWPEFRDLPRDQLLAVLPLGAVEAHGPHLPLGTDIVIAEAMALAGAGRLSRRGFEVVVLPALPVAPAPFAAMFEGTIDTPPAATTALVAGIAQSVCRHGARATLIANAHHDPAHVRAIRDAVQIVESEHAATLIFPDLTRRRWADQLTEEFRSGACHAGRYESSAMLAAEPHLVDARVLARLPANPHSLVDAIQRGDRTFADAGGPEAYFGWPADATAEEGREIIERLGAILEEAVMEILGNEERRTKNEERNEELRTKNGTTNGTTNGMTNETPNGMTNETTNGTTNEQRPSEQRRNIAPLLIVNPQSLGRPSGFSHGVVAPAGWRTVYVAGQTAADADGVFGQPDFASEFSTALGKVIEVVRAAGGESSHVARMTIYVTNLDTYRASRSRLAEVWMRHMGRHYPAMALVEVAGLVDRGATVEIQADAVLPPQPPHSASSESSVSSVGL